ncbi:related to C2H2 zinc finger protein [Cephalotrichum gorgonifer]|uniref:Related to C2H2 zinc finger protein n=1 Tax=Cephalotrichum gorgonifer TaxID=2041049 RepID=A0AAE8N491_9PEZI|nr:related to C2H2 zinc finger protein [Cephalotrichum gorgonifer]
MATVAAAHDIDDIKPVLPVSPASSSMMAGQDRHSNSPPELNPGYDGERGRRRSRSPENDGDDLGGDGSGDGNHVNSDGPSRKRRRSRRPGPGYSSNIRSASISYQSPKDHMGSPYSPVAHTPPPIFSAGPGSNGVDSYVRQDAAYGTPGARRGSFHSVTAPQRPSIQTNVNSYGVLSPASTQQGFHGQHTTTPQTVGYAGPQQNFTPFTLPPSNFSETAPREQEQHYAPVTSGDFSDNGQQSAGDMMMLDMSTNQTLPVFGNESILNNSPHFLPEDFVQFLFNESSNNTNGNNSPTIGPVMGQGYLEYSNNYASVPFLGNEGASLGYFPAAPQQVMAVSSILDQNLPEATISDEKSNEVFEFIRDRFLEMGRAPSERHRDYVVEGDQTQDDHMLSKRMMQAYIGSYWLNFSDQMPILHKPTFSPDKTPNILLIAMMTIGAACLDKTHGTEVTQAGSKVSNFLAWHIRWEIFMDPSFRPPAKLWLFQSLLLLELYEKMYSTRGLHERAHIHHATTITLMRRGRSLIGKSALDSPPNPADPRAGANGSRQSSASGAATPDEWWNHWITNEATRRAAFAAFVIDSIHATMFGHSTVMVAHEMRLPLPCDENLWKAASSAEVGRIEANLMSNKIKPISFLEGLKKTLSGMEVQTNSFGRMVLMAGLLSVTWHMNQRDLQVNVLGGGVSMALGGRDKWRGTLNRAFDSWKIDFDKALEREEASSNPYDLARRKENDAARESRMVLHHLAHMAMHVDVIDCQIFARAKRLLGRTIGPQDLNSAQRRMKEQWAPSAKARDATFYALKFLCAVLMPEAAGGSPQPSDAPPYSARDDVQLNRPWVLYFAVLVVWCYGYATEGPCVGAPQPATEAERAQLVRDYLVKFGGIQTPDDLKLVKGINNNTALLTVLRGTFASTRWELLHEGGILLGNCIALNSGKSVP